MREQPSKSARTIVHRTGSKSPKPCKGQLNQKMSMIAQINLRFPGQTSQRDVVSAYRKFESKLNFMPSNEA